MSTSKNLAEIYLFHLEKAYKQFKKYKTDIFKQAGFNLTSDQWILLKGIHETEGLSQRELAVKSYKEPASTTRILDLLEQKGWIERRAMPDNRRTYALYLTTAGHELVEKILPLAVEIRAKGMQGVSTEEEQVLKDILVRIFDNFNS